MSNNSQSKQTHEGLTLSPWEFDKWTNKKGDYQTITMAFWWKANIALLHNLASILKQPLDSLSMVY